MEKLVDCHFHIWDLDVNSYPWLTGPPSENIIKIIGDYSKLRRNYLIDDFKADIGDVNVVAAVHLQADVPLAESVQESGWLQSVADGPGAGMPQGFVASGDLRAPDAAAMIEAHCKYPNMRGIRAEMHPGHNAPADYNPLKDKVWLDNVALLEQHDLLFEVRAAAPEQSDDVVRLMAERPGMKFVFPHLGLSIWRDEEAIAIWRRNLKRFAELGNVYIKLSGYGLFGENWQTEDVKPFVFDCIEALGPDHLVCGSNYPIDSIAASYRRIWDTHSALLDEAGCSSDDRWKILHDTAVKLYRL